MGRYANKILVTIGLTAAAVLAVEGFTGTDFLNAEAMSLLCVLAAAPPVIATIRVHSDRTNQTIITEIRSHSERMETALNTTMHDHAQEMKRAVAEHGALVSKHETVLEKMGEIMNDAAVNLHRDVERWANSDTGPFPYIQRN